MNRFIDMTLRPVLIVGGLGTAAAGLYAFAPQFAVANIAGLEFRQEYTIFVQHWGFTVGLIGVMMVVAAFRPAWVLPVLIYWLFLPGSPRPAAWPRRKRSWARCVAGMLTC